MFDARLRVRECCRGFENVPLKGWSGKLDVWGPSGHCVDIFFLSLCVCIYPLSFSHSLISISLFCRKRPTLTRKVD